MLNLPFISLNEISTSYPRKHNNQQSFLQFHSMKIFILKCFQKHYHLLKSQTWDSETWDSETWDSETWDSGTWDSKTRGHDKQT